MDTESHPLGKVSLSCKYKGNFTILVEQDPPNILGLKICLDLGLIKRTYGLEEKSLDTEYADVFEGLGKIKSILQKILVDPNAILVMQPPSRVPMALCKLLKEELQRMEKL